MELDQVILQARVEMNDMDRFMNKFNESENNDNWGIY